MTASIARGPIGGPSILWVLPSWIYGAAVAARNRRFDAGRDVARLPCPVVSIGNLTLGGTGKTPMVAEVARMLDAAGRRPIVALRGYKSRDGRSDEAELHRQALPGMPVIVGADRRRAILESGVDLAPPSVMILDDGFQHRRLARDLDVVLVDATRPGLDDRLVPAGWLREPVGGLRRADVVIVTRATGVDHRLASRIEQAHGRPPVAWTSHAWNSLEVHGGTAGPELACMDWLRGRRVATLSGTGHPDSFRAMVREHGAEELANLPAADHQHYDAAAAARLERAVETAGASCLVTTAKDWVKLGRVWSGRLPAVVPSLSLRWIEGREAFLERLLQTIRRVQPNEVVPRTGRPAQTS